MSRPAVGRGRVLGGAGVARPGRLALSYFPRNKSGVCEGAFPSGVTVRIPCT